MILRGDAFIDHSVNTEVNYETEELFQVLREAISTLQPQQQELIQRIYFNGEKPADLAREYGILQSSINHRLSKIFAVLKKNLHKRGESFAVFDH